MVEQELIEAGWKPRDCRIGTLYFNGDFFCRLKDNGIAVVFRCKDDMNPIGSAGTVDDILPLMEKSDLAEINLLEATLSIMKAQYERKYNKKFIS